jgi:hypothetical protein
MEFPRKKGYTIAALPSILNLQRQSKKGMGQGPQIVSILQREKNRWID